MDRRSLTTWTEAYERAWRAPGTDGLGALFTENASYRTAPFAEPFRGLAAIARMWEEGREGADEAFALSCEIVAVEGDTGVLRLEVTYEAPPVTYRDLWIVRLREDGRCFAFEEWPFWPPGAAGEAAPGPGG